MWEGGHGKSDQLKWVKKGSAGGSFPPEVEFSEAGKLRDCAHSPIHLPGQVFTQATCAHCSFIHQVVCVCVCVCVTPWETPASVIWDSAQLCRKFVMHKKLNANKNSLGITLRWRVKLECLLEIKHNRGYFPNARVPLSSCSRCHCLGSAPVISHIHPSL